jgi:uncharacterized delta-60 repeat protein
MRRVTTTVVVFLFTLVCVTGTAAAFVFGSLDTSFGNGGIVRTVPPGSTVAQVDALGLQPDGKALVTGLADGSNPAWVERLLPNGSLDPSFGSAGKFVFSDLSGVQFYSVALQTDGKILLAGKAHTSGDIQLLVRLNADGTLDTNADSTPGTSFGVGGVGYIPSTASGESALSDVVVLPTGDILVAGTYKSGPDNLLVIHKFDSSGAPDTTFATNASTATGSFNSDFGDPVAVRILLDPSGNYIYAASSDTGVFTAIKLKPDGTILSSYGSGGYATLGSSVGMDDAIIDSTGRVTFSGAKYVPSPSYIAALGRLDATGQPDASFGTAGLTAVNATAADRSSVVGLRQLSDGRYFTLLLAFTASTKPYSATAVFTPGGQLDPSYGSGGVFTNPELGPGTYALGFETLPDGKALIGGITQSISDPGTAIVARVHGPNDLDPVVKLVPTSKISSPSKSKLKAKKLKKFAGTAGPVGKVSKVEIAVQKSDKKLLKNKKRCLWLSSNKAKFKKVKAVKKKCSSPKWLKASGTDAWSYKLKKLLPKGSYTLSVRATATDGSVQSTPTKKRFKIT